MSLVTQCPSCFTRFIVKPIQLKAYDGQVRCGQCQHVFMAADYLIGPSASSEFLSNNNKSPSEPLLYRAFAVYSGLLLLVFLQMLFFLRAEICKEWSAFKPAFVEACHLIGCSMPLPTHIELVSLDDTELVKDEIHAGNIRFNALIINNATFAQDFPTLSLTLTDNQDTPVIRRKFTPKEYLHSDQTKLLNGLAANDEIRITLNFKVANPAVSGFRAFLVY